MTNEILNSTGRISENLHKLMSQAFRSDQFKVQLMCRHRKTVAPFSLNDREAKFARKIAWSLKYFDDMNMKLTKEEREKIAKLIRRVKRTARLAHE